MDLFRTKNNIDSVKFDLLGNQYDSKFEEKYQNNIDISTFFMNNGGASYDKGIFRIHCKSSSFYWTNIVTEFFPKYKDKICCFGFDWMGRQFALDLKDANKNYLFDPATGEDFELQQSLNGFFNEELVNYRDDTLVPDDFTFVMHKLGLDILPPDKCIGYKKLLFLGGKDDLDNTEVIDMDVYWDLNYKIYSKINKMEEGSIIDKIKYL
jgi:hypothetical protein